MECLLSSRPEVLGSVPVSSSLRYREKCERRAFEPDGLVREGMCAPLQGRDMPTKQEEGPGVA